RGVILTVFGVALALLGEAGVGLMLIVSFVVMWLYPVLFEVYKNGQTIGKKSMGIRVCMDNGMPIGWQASMIRNLLILADFLPMMFLSGLLAMLFSRHAKRLGDRVAGTMVVRVPKQKASIERIAHRPSLPPMALTLEEQKAILSFVERAPKLPADRVAELVTIIAPITGKADIEAAADEIVGYANAIMGYNDDKESSGAPHQGVL
ncbi:MAG: RDD family protein, partial [Moraxella sp.]|nr:RDD family protein [Moraxella sp.]